MPIICRIQYIDVKDQRVRGVGKVNIAETEHNVYSFAARVAYSLCAYVLYGT